MKLRYAAVLILPLLSGCQADGLQTAVSGSVSQVAPDEFNAAKRALTASHALHASIANFMAIAANSNLCHAACAATAKDYLDRSETALVAADSLIAAGDAKGIEAKISAASLLMANIQALVGK